MFLICLICKDEIKNLNPRHKCYKTHIYRNNISEIATRRIKKDKTNSEVAKLDTFTAMSLS